MMVNLKMKKIELETCKSLVQLDKNFFVFTGSSVGVVPILGKGVYKAKIDKIGSVSTKII